MVNSDDLRGAASVVERLGLEFLILYRPEAKVVRQCGNYNLPHDSAATPSAFVIDKSEYIRWMHLGEYQYDQAADQEIIGPMLELS